MSVFIQGPVTAYLYVSDQFFYGEGVFESDDCDHDINHAVLITGWGIDQYSGLEYWIIKNSWSTDWADNGYLKLRRNAGGRGMCRIAQWVYQVFEY